MNDNALTFDQARFFEKYQGIDALLVHDGQDYVFIENKLVSNKVIPANKIIYSIDDLVSFIHEHKICLAKDELYLFPKKFLLELNSREIHWVETHHAPLDNYNAKTKEVLNGITRSQEVFLWLCSSFKETHPVDELKKLLKKNLITKGSRSEECYLNLQGESENENQGLLSFDFVYSSKYLNIPYSGVIANTEQPPQIVDLYKDACSWLKAFIVDLSMKQCIEEATTLCQDAFKAEFKLKAKVKINPLFPVENKYFEAHGFYLIKWMSELDGNCLQQFQIFSFIGGRVETHIEYPSLLINVAA